ncbi:MAG: flotillin family protein [Verrucomicrobia bacterium]|jgi:flotillin|nr:flotillin family protein [Verrucomicrobiota bacterium]OQC67034.1 MAG: Inner membrane protein YqiK [Verrucomicrobia bacterium ADurb.Bin006]MDI9382304.1 SPFH domain-containing protein [Verrucomicrobiota bacterium]NMD20130.1 flotillin family protein [Verrucomicrobiota bacterium]HOA60561.1 SPFH domain-containing protein [Verrucomicrobiota bacterium]
MNIMPLLAQVNLLEKFWVVAVALIVPIVVIISIVVVLSRYTKVGPNQVLIISGRKHAYRDPDGSEVKRGFRIVKGGGTFVYPVVEKVDILSLELLTIDVQTPEVYTSKGVPVKVDGVAQIKVKGDDISIATAAEQFLGKRTDEIRNIATQTLEGHLRAILGTMTVEDIYQNRDAFASKVQEVAAGDMANMGLGIVSFTIRDIRDGQGYLEALGKPRIAQVKRDAVIAQAEADRDAQIKSSQATQAGQEAKFAADTKIAEAQRDYQTNVAMYQAAVNQKKAEADLAYDLQKFKTGQLVKAEEVQVQIIEKQKQIELQQQEILRKQRELEANVQKPADAERYKVETLANAKKFQLETEAAGAASATKAAGFAGADVAKATGIAEAEANKARGLAEAAIIEAQGKANAEAMRLKAESFKQYNEAAVIEMIVRVLPDVAGKVSEPLSKTEKIVIINSGGGLGGGASKLTGDVTQIIGQLPPVIESLTGIKFERLLEQVPALKKAMGKPDKTE